MALVTYPLNNIDYSAEDAELYHCTRTSGVFAADEDFSATVTGADNIVNIGQGIAWIRNSRFSGKVVANKSTTTIDMGLADGTYARIDAIVLRFDANKNTTEIVKKEGVASSSPVAPEVVRTESVYELHIYHVQRRAGATSILASDIADLRHDRQHCGVMVDDVTMYGDEYVKRDEVGSANGVASLDASGKVPSAQLPSMNYIPTSQKGVANGVASLDGNGKVPAAQNPAVDYVVEQGKNTVEVFFDDLFKEYKWEWKKWKSGKVELFASGQYPDHNLNFFDLPLPFAVKTERTFISNGAIGPKMYFSSHVNAGSTADIEVVVSGKVFDESIVYPDEFNLYAVGTL